ncbi:transposase, partial [Planctomycetota bacterium]
MGEANGNLFEPDFNRAVKVQATDQRITSHAGALLLREFDHQLGLTESLANQLFDPRDPDRIRYQAVELIRERCYAMAMGDSAQDDLDRLAQDPALKIACWDRPGEETLNQRLASQPTQSRLVGWLADCKQNVEALRNSLCDWLHRHLRSTSCSATSGSNDRRVRHATIDIDSFPIEVHGKQKGAAYNGYYKDN